MEFDFNRRPFLVIWETTHACDLACVHCRAQAEPEPSPEELSTREGLKLIGQVKAMGTPLLIFSGGDPLKRGDLPVLVRSAKSLGLRTGAIPAVTPLLTSVRIKGLQEAGLDQIAFSLDAASAKEHDAFRQTQGVFARTLEAVRDANAIGLNVQINSLINLHNLGQLDELIRLIESLEIVFWEVFFLVPTGRGKELPVLNAGAFDAVFEKLYALGRRAPFIIKVTEAPHYRRFFHEKENAKGRTPDLPAPLRQPTGPKRSIGLAPGGVNAGKGFIFVSYRGEVFPSGFLPLKAGSVREDTLEDIYRNAPLLRQLRDPAQLKGKCGVCAYREICGGSRSRAWAITGDYLAEDPCCAYEK